VTRQAGARTGEEATGDDRPFGFTGGSDPDRGSDSPGGADPMAALFGSLGATPADLGALLHKLGDLPLLAWRTR